MPILGHQGEGSITDIAVRRLLTLQGTMRPEQIISLMRYASSDNTLAMGDHDDHIHVGFRRSARTKAGRQLAAAPKPGQWIKLIDRLGEIENPKVAAKPSASSITGGGAAPTWLTRSPRRVELHCGMRSVLLMLLALLALPASAAAQAQAPVDDTALPLVYVFVLDGLDGDHIDAGHSPFLASALADGATTRATYYQESRSVMVAETNPTTPRWRPGRSGTARGSRATRSRCYDEASKTAWAAPGRGRRPGDRRRAADCVIAENFFGGPAPGAHGITTAGIFGKPKLARLFSTKRLTPPAYDADHLWTPCEPGRRTPTTATEPPARPNDGYSVVDAPVMDHVLDTVGNGVQADGA